MSLNIIPKEIITQYELHTIAVNFWVYMEIRKGMPGLKQSGIFSHDRLKTHLAKYGYQRCRQTPALWTHTTRPFFFSLVVDNFRVKSFGRRHLDHLINALRDQY